MIANKPFSAKMSLLAGLAAATTFCATPAQASPPAPFNLVYGVVRDAYGTPLTSSNAQIVLQTPTGVVISTQVIPGYAPGVNYRLKVPMDSGATATPYEYDALLAAADYKLYVILNGATNLPIEMTGNYKTLGLPGQTARIDLTLGVDSNGDGIPDSWELAFLSELGLNIPLSSINANSILTSDGLTLRQQYLFGTYPFNPSVPCQVTFAGFVGGLPSLQFPTITAHFYSVLASSDMVRWSTVQFYLPTDDPNGASRSYYYAPGIVTAEVHVVIPPNDPNAQFYRILVQ